MKFALSPKVVSVATKAGKFIQTNSPTILTGFAVVGLVGTVISAVNATPKAVRLVEEERYERDKVKYYFNQDDVPDTDDSEPLTKLEIVKLTWKEYIPTAIIGGATIACIIGAHGIHSRRNAALAALYSVSQKAYEEYQEKVKQTVGQNKEGKIRDEIAQDVLNRNPVDKLRIQRTARGDTLCFDILSGRYFFSDAEFIRQSQNEFNHQLLNEMNLCLNDFYGILGLDSIDLGEEVGWSVDKMLDIRFASKLASDGTPCLVLDYHVKPIFEYRNW